MVLHIEPGALILRFVLDPNHLGSEGVSKEEVNKLIANAMKDFAKSMLGE